MPKSLIKSHRLFSDGIIERGRTYNTSIVSFFYFYLSFIFYYLQCAFSLAEPDNLQLFWLKHYELENNKTEEKNLCTCLNMC